MKTAISAAVFGLVVLSGAIASAQTDDAVVVLYNGGVETVPEIALSLDGAPSVVNLGTRRILPAAIGPARVADLKILPDGSYLLADVDGRGAVVTTPNGESLRWVLDDEQRFTNMDTASVASYFAPGEPSLIVTGDSSGSNVTVRGTSQGNVAWFDTFRITASRVAIPQVAVLPENLLAVAVNYSDIGIWGVQLRDTSDILDDGMAILSATNGELPQDAVILPELDLVRDLFGTADGSLHVVTRYSILEIDLEGNLLGSVDLADHPEMSGQFASMVILASGRWAIATFEPGEWINPHVNHRVHWFDKEDATVLATSEPLSRAPLRVEAAAGHGGTGTFGFDAGLQAIEQGDATEIELVSLVAPPTVRIGGEMSVRGVVENVGPSPVGLVTLAVRGHAGDCEPDKPADYDFAVAESVALQSGQSFTVAGRPFIDGQFTLGPWCLFVEGRDRDGMPHRYGDPQVVRILEQDGSAGSTIDVIDLPYGARPAPDAGIGDAGDGGPDVGMGDPKGCCAVVATDRQVGAGWLLLLSVVVVAQTRRSSR